MSTKENQNKDDIEEKANPSNPIPSGEGTSKERYAPNLDPQNEFEKKVVEDDLLRLELKVKQKRNTHEEVGQHTKEEMKVEEEKAKQRQKEEQKKEQSKKD